MRKSIILNTHQVTRLQDTGSLVVVDMVNPQPVHGSLEISGNELLHTQPDGFVDCAQYPIKIPYTIGSSLYVRERWGILGEEIVSISDLTTYKDGNLDFNYTKWQSPATMPKSAARLFPVVESREVVRCRDVTKEQDETYKINFCLYIISRFGQSFWDTNGFIFLTTLKLNK